MKAPRRTCSACSGPCYWHDEAWVCDDCDSEWYPDHGPEYEAPTDPEPATCSAQEDSRG